MQTQEHTILAALKALSSVDQDHATYANGVGFNGRDTSFGNDLAKRDWLSPKQEKAAYKMLRTYRKQLLNLFGIDYDLIPEPKEVSEQPKMTLAPSVHQHNAPAPVVRKVQLTEKGFVVSFSYDAALVADIKLIPRHLRAFDSETKEWTIQATPNDSLEYFASFLKDYGFSAKQEVHDKLTELRAAYQAAITLPEDTTYEPSTLKMELRPFQKVGVEKGLNWQRILIGDEMGLGKTIQALAIASEAGAFPALVVCPSNVKYHWQRMFHLWTEYKAVVINKEADLDEAADIYIINYDLLSRDIKPLLKDGKQVVINKKKQWDFSEGRLGRILELKLQTVICDETHYIKNDKARRTVAVKKILDQAQPQLRIFTTGTAIINRPVELLPQLEALGVIKDFGGTWNFLQRYCGAKQIWTGRKYVWDFSGASNLDELRHKLLEVCYIRRLKVDVAPELPAKQRTPIQVDLSNEKEYRKAETDFINWIKAEARNDEAFLTALDQAMVELGIEDDTFKDRMVESYTIDSAQKALRAEVLTKINKLKQLTGKGKIDAAVNWVKDFLETGEKLIVFAHHREVQDALLAEFPEAAHVLGDDNSKTRDDNVQRFQEDDDCQLIVCSLKAGGVGITLTAASNVLFTELGWTPAEHDQAEDRAHRIGQDAEMVNIIYLLGRNTIDETIGELIEEKREVVRQVLDGKQADTSGSIIGNLLQRMVN